MAASAGSAHEVQCSFESHEIKIVLAHHPSRATHQHTLAERFFLTASNDGDHPDHRFCFTRETATTPAADPNLPHATAMQAALTFTTAFADLPRKELIVDAHSPRYPPLLGTNAPAALLQCVVMRR